MTMLGYLRVSKHDGSQVLDLQRDAVVAAGVEPKHLYEEMASGRHDDRPVLAACLKALRPGDVLVTWKLDRLGRSLRHLVNTVHDLSPPRALVSRSSRERAGSWTPPQLVGS